VRRKDEEGVVRNLPGIIWCPRGGGGHANPTKSFVLRPLGHLFIKRNTSQFNFI